MLSVLNLFPEEHKTNQPAFFSGVKKIDFIREAAKKVLFLLAGPLRPPPPPRPYGPWEQKKKKKKKK